jgi:hypothetical protein
MINLRQNFGIYVTQNLLTHLELYQLINRFAKKRIFDAVTSYEYRLGIVHK